jgi:hypothetical protein
MVAFALSQCEALFFLYNAVRHRYYAFFDDCSGSRNKIIGTSGRQMKGMEIAMSIFQNLINFTAGLMGILFDKYEGSLETAEGVVEADDLTQIDGIGPTFASRLYDAGVNTFAQLAAISPEQVQEITHVTGQGSPAAWIAEAQSRG